jgi:autophagy-related protein 5
MLMADKRTLETMSRFLHARLPLQFRPPGEAPKGRRAAYTLVQGVLCSPDAEMAWLGACLAGTDGWVNVCFGVSHN